MNLTPRELANVLLGLRTLQHPLSDFIEGGEMILDGHDQMSSEEIDELCQKINFNHDPVAANPPIIYDSWANEEDGEPGFCDRYTVFPQHGSFEENKTDFLGCSMGGRAFSQWGEVPPGHTDRLGRRVTLEQLDEDTRRHIIARITEDY